jgi:hypothetical protein
MKPTPEKYFENPAFREYIFLLVELERLFREGRGQTPEADVIREAMDFPSHRFSAAEDAAISEFGAHLTEMSRQYGVILPRTVEGPVKCDAALSGSPNAAHPEHSREFAK